MNKLRLDRLILRHGSKHAILKGEIDKNYVKSHVKYDVLRNTDHLLGPI